MKSIGLSDVVYYKLLNYKHKVEKENGGVISFDKIIESLIISCEGINSKDSETVK